MTLGTKLKTGLVAVTVAAGLLASASTAEARGLRSGFLPGLIGGLALGAFAASAQAAQHDSGFPMIDDRQEFWPQRQARTLAPAQAQVRQRTRRTISRQGVPASRVSAAHIESCRNQIASSSRPLGAVAVHVTGVGPAVRNREGVLSVPLNARIEYARKGKRQVRQARVSCQVRDGQVVAFR